jgi:ParB-like nuclease domain
VSQLLGNHEAAKLLKSPIRTCGATLMDCHPFADLFPEMTDDEFRELKADIAEHGQIDPIITHDGQIVDGRHRYRACTELGLPPKVEEWTGQGGSLLTFVISKNAKRRQLTKSQLACIAVDVKRVLEKEIAAESIPRLVESGRKGGKAESKHFGNNAEVLSDKKAPKRDARKEAAKTVGVAERYISDVERIKEQSPEVFEAVKAGSVTISRAMKDLDKTKPNKSMSLPEVEVEQFLKALAEVKARLPKDRLADLAARLVTVGGEILRDARDSAIETEAPAPDGDDATYESLIGEDDSIEEQHKTLAILADYTRSQYWLWRLRQFEVEHFESEDVYYEELEPADSPKPLNLETLDRLEADMVRLAKEMAAAKDQRKPPGRA